jgi:hypothetical protein
VGDTVYLTKPWVGVRLLPIRLAKYPASESPASTA